METIKLPESELAEMKQFYQEEYERLSRRLQHIKTILERLGVEIQEENLTGVKPQASTANVVFPIHLLFQSEKRRAEENLNGSC
jgi:hypothetical protein